MKSTNSYVLGSGRLSYTRMRELVFGAVESLGYPKENFSQLKKRWHNWKSETEKYLYVKDKLESLLLVSQSLNKKH